MKIDFPRLEQNLQKHKVMELSSDKNDSGVARAIQYVWSHTYTKNVDFDSFTLNDALRAFYEFYTLPVYEDEPTEAEIAETRNCFWSINSSIDEVAYRLVQNKNKVYENDDDFI